MNTDKQTSVCNDTDKYPHIDKIDFSVKVGDRIYAMNGAYWGEVKLVDGVQELHAWESHCFYQDGSPTPSNSISWVFNDSVYPSRMELFSLIRDGVDLIQEYREKVFAEDFKNNEMLNLQEPNCEHVHDIFNYDGVRCVKCGAWYCS